MQPTATFSGSRLEQRRQAKRLTQHDLASGLRRRGFGTTQTTISRWESGQIPQGAVLPALAAELDCTIGDLYEHGAVDDEDESEAVTAAMPLDEYLRSRVRQILAEEERKTHDGATVRA